MIQHVIFATGAINRVAQLAFELNIKQPMIVTGGKSYEISGARGKIEKAFKTVKRGHFPVSTRLPEFDEIKRGVIFFKDGSFDCIIAIGGGSVLDTAKLIRFFSVQDSSFSLDPGEVNLIKKQGVPVIAIPTTAGSGAEATHFAVLYVDKIKHSIAHPHILPNIALVDPDLSQSVPSELAAASGLDALSQGIESFWSISATPISREFAKQAIILAFNSLIPAVRDNDANARTNLSKSALLAGQAINISKTTAPHALSYTLTARFGVPHGHAVSLTLGGFLKSMGETGHDDINHPLGKSHVTQTLNELCHMLNATDPTSACNTLRELMTTLGLSVRLSSLGIRKSDFDMIIDNINLERLSNHPTRINSGIIRNILNEIA